MNGLRAWLDASPLSELALLVMREATGRRDPIEPLRPARSAPLRSRARIGLWSLAAGAGVSTTAALMAHRSSGAGRATLLIDLDRWVPSLALRAQLQAATVADALLRPGREQEALSRWAGSPFLPGAPGLHAIYETDRILGLLERLAGDAPMVIDLGTGADSLDLRLLGTLDRLCVVGGPRAAQLQAAFCAVDLLRDAPCGIGFVTTQASDEDATRIASRLPWPLLAAIPFDPYLAEDAFATRAPTAAAVDRLIRAVS